MSTHDDDNLTRFLKEYQPLPPSPPLNHEQTILSKLDQQQPPFRAVPQRKSHWRWSLPTVVAAGLIVMVGYGGIRPLLSPDEVSNSEAIALTELETFLEESWAASGGEFSDWEDDLTDGYSLLLAQAVPES